METETCSYILTAGKRAGQQCGSFILRDGLCSTHTEQKEIDTVLGTCSHKFIRGPRTGCYCPNPATDDGLCWLHCIITEYDEKMCKVVLKSGPQKGGFCQYDAFIDGYCYSHAMFKTGLDKIQSEPFLTCSHLYFKGSLVGKYCRRPSKENGVCSVHGGSTNKVPKKLQEPSIGKYPTCHHQLDETISGGYCTKNVFHNNLCKEHATIPDISCCYVFRSGPNRKTECGRFCVATEPNRCKKHVGKISHVESEPKKSPKQKKQPKNRCKADVIESSHMCRSITKKGDFCRVHSHGEEGQPRETGVRCHAEIVKVRKCFRKVVGDTRHCSTHQTSSKSHAVNLEQDKD